MSDNEKIDNGEDETADDIMKVNSNESQDKFGDETSDVTERADLVDSGDEETADEIMKLMNRNESQVTDKFGDDSSDITETADPGKDQGHPVRSPEDCSCILNEVFKVINKKAEMCDNENGTCTLDKD